jgi:hypothetical protein
LISCLIIVVIGAFDFAEPGVAINEDAEPGAAINEDAEPGAVINEDAESARLFKFV